ncbi:ATP-dependent DNA ligase LigD phosphoesterase module /ATP-dependent DNA ligase LigD polymerase module [Salegentibacter echinorum]|uniref:DNA ligase (ATP) n=1 Tax=Salegentibacter echinorum TaxID=1073325 RepID=A0A1M5LAE7_SALEC|nr:DNA ligase D [Salegentibacter echinorum]SHG61978.1 ATP-dependent DNA ligase LigD phosphoesterase module /ATP-dependent DNA ligase LigD polymerase module [Salegentibacter echinorum]
MSLDDYSKKRNFKNTPEPGADFSTENRGRFVIQRHEASHLHYDLRLEMDGVLKSWAVPKGPSMNPKDKRLAIQTEDHPVKYLHFEGTIPKGNYGAGEMQIWDNGTFNAAKKNNDDLLQQWKDGNLKIVFSGEKIKGEFALVKTNRGDKKNQWLLIKKKDKAATELDYDAEVFAKNNSEKKDGGKVKEIKLSEFIKPMLATTGKKIFNDPGWIYELKWDGYRALANIENNEVDLYSRNGVSFNTRFSKLVKDLESIENDVILDGEIVVLNKDGIPQFQELQNYTQKTPGKLVFYVFDMLFLNGHSMLDLALTERKSLIPEVIEGLDHVKYCDHIEGMGTAFYKKAIESGMEGVIAKKANATYSPGYRSENWLKIKAENSREVIICGYTTSKGAVFGSLIMGAYKNDELEYIGNCGTGFSNDEQKNLLKKFKSRERKTSPFPKKINLKGREPVWMRPDLIAEVKFSEITKTGKLRHPVFKALRKDKEVSEILAITDTKSKTSEAKKAKNTSRNKSGETLEIDGVEVPFTNLGKVYWPESDFRKYDLIDYYIQVSEIMLPYLKDRPQNLHRHPNGITKKGFYQKDNEGNLPKWVTTKKLYSESADKKIEYLLCQNEATLLYMANLGCIEINPWNSKIGSLENPDYTVIDLDPSENNSFNEVIEVAQAAKEVLDLAKIEGYCKTSGSSGLHIYLPLAGNYTYDEARDFTKLLCYYIAEKLPKLTSMDRAKKKRKNKIYLDYLQNRQGQTLAAAYCARPKPGAPVSAPLAWEEVKSGLEIRDFNIKNMPQRLTENGDLFQGVLDEGIQIEKAIESLENS